MVDITQKNYTLRKAIARATISVSKAETIDLIKNKQIPKGDVFEFSRVAGLFAIKNTSSVIPDCHPLPIEFSKIDHQIEGLKIHILVEVHTIYKTGVEVEAMHGASITALTMYDMLKPVDKKIIIESIQLIEKKGGKTDYRYEKPENINIAIVICSDSVSKGINEDTTGNKIYEKMKQYPYKIVSKEAIPDDYNQIQNKAKELLKNNVHLVLFAGGTGLSKRDLTPDAIKPLLSREIPGIMETSRNYGQQRTPYSMLSRGIAGFIEDKMLVITLPGSPKGAIESLDAILPQLFHVFKVLDGARHN